jgi:hypothetical protein
MLELTVSQRIHRGTGIEIPQKKRRIGDGIHKRVRHPSLPSTSAVSITTRKLSFSRIKSGHAAHIIFYVKQIQVQ